MNQIDFLIPTNSTLNFSSHYIIIIIINYYNYYKNVIWLLFLILILLQGNTQSITCQSISSSIYNYYKLL